MTSSTMIPARMISLYRAIILCSNPYFHLEQCNQFSRMQVVPMEQTFVLSRAST